MPNPYAFRVGGIFTFGDPEFYGSAGGGCLGADTVAIGPNSEDGGYRIATTNAQVVQFNMSGAFKCPTTPVAPASANPTYANCTAVWNAIGGPIYRGQPGYTEDLDSDKDGVGCESDPR